MKSERPVDIERFFEDGTEIDEALGRAAQQARKAHVDAGLPLPIWRDGKTVWLEPEEIERMGEEGVETRRRTER